MRKKHRDLFLMYWNGKMYISTVRQALVKFRQWIDDGLSLPPVHNAGTTTWNIEGVERAPRGFVPPKIEGHGTK